MPCSPTTLNHPEVSEWYVLSLMELTSTDSREFTIFTESEVGESLVYPKISLNHPTFVCTFRMIRWSTVSFALMKMMFATSS